MIVHLADVEQTQRLGRLLAECLPDDLPEQIVLLDGGLGVGKTTLTRSMVEAMPGGEEAEPGSPSFNIYNIYPTTPETAHIDLYRLEGMPVDESVLEFLLNRRYLIIVEWSSYLPEAYTPRDRLLLSWLPEKNGRRIRFNAQGDLTQAYWDCILPRLFESFKTIND